MKTIAIVNQKGGVAKTATAHALGAGLARRGYRVLLVDLDAQGSLTYSTGATADGGAWDALTRAKKPRDAVQDLGAVEILAASPALADADAAFTDATRANRLREALRGGRWDYCIIDTPPALGLLAVNALTAADYVVIPAQADAFSVRGLYAMAQTLDEIRGSVNPKIRVAGVLACRYKGNTRAARAFIDGLEKAAAAVGGSLFKTRIRECMAMQEAAALKLSIFDYAPRSNAAADYDAFTAEIIERTGTK